eukprot:TRINITY_DN69603_c0_g1_i1.p1 TRINITY_DN69603_c0_g1~~TRINITY_DN69603_c0_g1_i1.p1  ORF type:complete len:223 (+),score=31.76 TRINITY_DN69603_c0_g1_i1:50-718(+)
MADAKQITILGIGSLLSERSSRVTFPRLENFRLVRISGYRRVFAHTPAIFHQCGIANKETLEMASLSAEACEGCSFVVSAFEVADEGNGMEAFRYREGLFELHMVSYTSVDGSSSGEGMLCCRSTTDACISRWGEENFKKLYVPLGLDKIWEWSVDSGLRPCRVYLRHCVLAAEKLADVGHASFLDETFLCDRKTTVRSYLAAHPEVMLTAPPESLRERYSG